MALGIGEILLFMFLLGLIYFAVKRLNSKAKQ